MAVMLEQLGLAPGQRVLEIGAGTGYNAALMAHIVGDTGDVTTMDIDADLVAGAREHLAAAGFDRVRVVCGDGGLGYPSAAPYDRIILTVGAWDITPSWREQLRVGGRLLLPLSIRGPQMCVAFEQADGHLQSVSIEECGFMALRCAFAGPGGYVQIGEIDLGVADPGRIDPNVVSAWLKGSRRDLPTGVRVRWTEVLGPLSQWLALRELGYCSLRAPGGAADGGLTSNFFRWTGASVAPTYMFTVGVVGQSALCMLIRSPEATVGPDGAATGVAPFELFLRTCGPDATLAQRLLERIQAWDAAGRPSRKGLRIRVYPKDAGYRPSASELVVDKRWSRLVLDWPEGG